MQNIPLCLATPDMVLARDVIRGDGIVLCGKGTQLSDKLIERLGKMNITSITVEGHPVIRKEERTLEQELADLDERFYPRTGDPILMLVKKMIKDLIVASWE